MRPMWDPVGDAISSAVKDAWMGLAQKLYEGVVAALQWLSTWWLNIPAPSLTADGGDSPAQKVMLYTRALIGVVGMISTVFVVVQYAMRKGNHSGEQLGWALGRVVVFSGLTLSVVMLLLTFGDQSAPWFVKTIGGEADFTKSMTSLSGNQQDVMRIMGDSGLTLILIIVFLLALIGSLANLFFMLFTYAMLPIVAGMIPVLAAGSVTERGAAAFHKVIGWTLATCLFKPIAGIIYGGGIAMVRLLTSSEGSKLGSDQIALQTIAGFMVMGAAGLVLPALVRLVVPTMAAASRGVGAGGLVLAGAALAGGAVMGGASLMAKFGGSRAQALAAGGRTGASLMGGGPGGNLGGPAPEPVNRGLVNPARHGYQSPPPRPQPQPASSTSGPPKAPPVDPSELAGPKRAVRPPAPRPTAPRSTAGPGRRRMGAAGDHLTQQLHRVEDGVEGGES